VHADAGADMLIPSGMLEGSARALRSAVSSTGRPELPIAAMIKLDSVLYSAHRIAVEAVPVSERAVPLIAVDDPAGARTRAAREVAAGADAVVVKPGLVTLDLVTRVSESVDRPVMCFFTADEHGFFTSSDDPRERADAERETFAAARRAGADLIISYGARSLTSE
jgi:porphobilinogen synthase